MSTEIQASEMANLIDESRHDPQARELGRKVLDALGAGNQVEEQDVFLRHASSLENLDSHGCGATCTIVLDGLWHGHFVEQGRDVVLPVANMGSRRSTHRSAMSSGNLS